ncbi:MAG: hypothetical protein KKA81_09660 [Bacteroidetes bacterium]|nr:hypothetical protein [Bacteroidota bacterium]
METICIRCGNSFETDTWNMDVCPDCELELSRLENEEEMESEFEESDDWSSSDDY